MPIPFLKSVILFWSPPPIRRCSGGSVFPQTWRGVTKNDKMKRNISVGDVFAIQIEQSQCYYFGRVLLDVQKQYDKNGQKHNYLDWQGQSLLIETYKHISEKFDLKDYDIAIQSIFVPKKYLLEEDITVIGNVPVDPKLVTFPETLKNFERDYFLTTGELALKTTYTADEAENHFKVFPTLENTYYIQIATLDYAGRTDLIVDKEDIMDNYFKFSDLKSLPQKRAEIYQQLGEDHNMSYYDLALKHGFDLCRLYKK